MKLYLTRFLLLSILIFSAAGYLPAAGSGEARGAYREALQQTFDEVIEEIYNSDIDAAEAKDRVAGIRSRYKIYYTDEAGILDAIIDRADEQSLSPEEAGFYFRLLQDGSLMDYRRQARKQETDKQLRELLSLLEMKLETENGTPDPDELTGMLNNYYDFTGMDYDDDYFRLTRLIQSLENGSISAVEMAAGIESMKNRRPARDSGESIGDISAYRDESADAPAPTGASQQGGNVPPAGQTSQTAAPGAPANSQKPETSGPETRR